MNMGLNKILKITGYTLNGINVRLFSASLEKSTEVL